VPFGLCANSDPASPTACVLPSTCAGGLGVCEDFERTCTNATQCEAAAYATPAVAIDRVDVNLALIDAALSAQPPQGLTPTVPALQGALQQTRTWQAAHPEQTVATLLVTDGLPTDCAGNPAVTDPVPPIERVLDLAEEGAAGTPPVRTFVIGVFSPGDAASVQNVNAIAAAGRTGSAITVDSDGDVSAQFLQGLRSVTAAATTCRSPLEAVSGLDYTRANVVELNGNDQVQRLRFVGDRQACATTADGWFYDVPPQSGPPGAVELCPVTCERIRGTPAAGLLVQIGCLP
jgi:hypothetical protein